MVATQTRRRFSKFQGSEDVTMRRFGFSQDTDDLKILWLRILSQDGEEISINGREKGGAHTRFDTKLRTEIKKKIETEKKIEERGETEHPIVLLLNVQKVAREIS